MWRSEVIVCSGIVRVEMQRKQQCIALVTTAILLLVSGYTYRAVAERYSVAFDRLPIEPGTLAKLPERIGSWTGTDVELDPAIVERSDSDDHVNRSYVNDLGREVVSLYFSLGGRGRDLLPHRPEVCYPAAGWILENSEKIELQSQTDRHFVCTLYTFTKGGLANQRLVVLNYFINDGSVSADVKELRSHAVVGLHGLSYFARVQLTTPLVTSERDAKSTITEFVVLAADHIFQLLDEIEHAELTGSATTH